jgi:hypothetical protein
VVVYCPNKFDLLEIEDVETERVLDSLKSKDMELLGKLQSKTHSR